MRRVPSIHNVRHTLAALAVVLALLTVSTAAAQVSYLGLIRDGLSSPTSLDAGPGHIAVLQPYNSQLLVYTADGAISRRIDISGDSRGLARLSDSVYLFCDRKLGRVNAVDLGTGRQWVFIGSLGTPEDVVVYAGTCYVLDSQNGRIITADAQGSRLREIPLTLQPGLNPSSTSRLAFDPGRGVFHVFDQQLSRIHVLDAAGNYMGNYCSFGHEPGTITRGGGLACDLEGFIYILDRYQGSISVFDPESNFVFEINTREIIGEPLLVPSGISVDPAGAIYVASTENHTIHIFHLDKSSLPTSALAATPIHPSPDDVLEAGKVQLVARVVAADQGSSRLAADFRVVSAGNPGEIVAEISGLEVEEPGRDDLGRLVGTASWQPGNLLEPNTHYQWQARARTEDRTGGWSALAAFSTLPPEVRFNLEANYPNPFNPWTTIAFSVPETKQAQLIIFNLSGMRVWAKTFHQLTAGRHTVTWEGTDSNGNQVASGVYFYRFQTQGFEQTRKMVLIR